MKIREEVFTSDNEIFENIKITAITRLNRPRKIVKTIGIQS